MHRGKLIAFMSTFASVASTRGPFILFEGIDRCGKTTQCSLIAEHLSKLRSTQLIRFPDRSSSIGKLINSYLQCNANLNDQTIHLLFSANRWESSSEIEQKLLSGTTLICDRYAYSGVAFTSAKGLDLEWCKTCDRGLPAPDCVIYLDIPVDAAAQRGNYGEERYEKIEFQSKIRETFMQLKTNDEIEKKIPWFVLDAKQSMEVLHSQIQNIVNEITVKVESDPVGKLWI